MSINKNKLKQQISRLYKLIPSFSDPYSLRVLLYHSISKKNNYDNLWALNIENFKSHLDYLLSSKHDIYAAESLERIIPKNGYVITFDDGLIDNFEFAAPELLTRKIPFTIFVIANELKQSNNKYLSVSMLRELSENSLVNIGSHSFNHIRLDQCSAKQLEHEIFSSKSYLEDLTGKEISLFSYPFGAYNNLVKSSVRSAGYKLAFTSNFNVNNFKQDRFLLNRNEIWSTDNLKFFKQKLDGDWDWLKYRITL